MKDLSVLLNGLNPTQREAVLHTEGPLLIAAGAGSGKTRVLTHRMAFVVASGLAGPENILAVTFTNKAAREMETRAVRLMLDLGIPVYEPPWISTFHSIGVRILRQYADRLGFNRQFVIYDSDDQLSMIKRSLKALDISDKIYPAKSGQAFINHCKTLGIEAVDSHKQADGYRDQTFVKVYHHYEEALKVANAFDFADLLLKTNSLFNKHPDVLEAYQERFRYLFVDEYQDTNSIQYEIVKKLSAKSKNLCVVGDEDQSIYSWRGADIRNIMEFETDFANARLIKLEQNYRSTKNIVRAASGVIANNSLRKPKELFTDNTDGSQVFVREESTDYDEAKYCAAQIRRWMESEFARHKDIAIFYRTNAQSRVLEEQLRAASIPYKLIGAVRFFDRMEIKDALSYLRLVYNPSDDLAFLRAINTPPRGIGKTSLERLSALAQREGLPLFQAAQMAVSQTEIPKKARKGLEELLVILEELFEFSLQAKVSELYQRMIQRTKYIEFLRSQDTGDADSRIQNLEELSNAFEAFENERGEEATLAAFLEEIALISDIDKVNPDEDAVTLMTLHISKGLEFPYVIIIGVEESLFPSYRTFDLIDGDALEEERRLAYVGMTRAEKELHLTYTRRRKVWGQDQFNPPSRFISEIPKELISFSSSIYSPRGTFSERHGLGARPISNSKSTPSHWADDHAQNFSESETGSVVSIFRPGLRVRHSVFGSGTVYGVEGSGENMKLTVDFDNQRLKTLVAKYARLEILR
ncbi:MAG: ATP-dependent DNA helicase [Bdellovibrionales bacterium CG10_big_fil_rev_8_21_14_0_10_45_34]|nr:MAG: ATP-dependent DNA helicase [Bdellovibrionales bacterium CG10_big_fil_rev_8_21_14_0_10_45_34]